MPQEINKENVTAHVQSRVMNLRNHIRNLRERRAKDRTDGERMHTIGMIDNAKLSLLDWQQTSELFGIELPED